MYGPDAASGLHNRSEWCASKTPQRVCTSSTCVFRWRIALNSGRTNLHKLVLHVPCWVICRTQCPDPIHGLQDQLITSRTIFVLVSSPTPQPHQAPPRNDSSSPSQLSLYPSSPSLSLSLSSSSSPRLPEQEQFVFYTTFAIITTWVSTIIIMIARFGRKLMYAFSKSTHRIPDCLLYRCPASSFKTTTVIMIIALATNSTPKHFDWFDTHAHTKSHAVILTIARRTCRSASIQHRAPPRRGIRSPRKVLGPPIPPTYSTDPTLTAAAMVAIVCARNLAMARLKYRKYFVKCTRYFVTIVHTSRWPLSKTQETAPLKYTRKQNILEGSI